MAVPTSRDHKLDIPLLFEGQQKSGGLILRIILGSMIVKPTQRLEVTQLGFLRRKKSVRGSSEIK